MQQEAKDAVEATVANPEVNAELKRTLLEFTKSTLEAVRDTAGATVDFAKEQLPLVLQEIVTAQVLYHLMWLAFTVMLLVLVHAFARKCRKNADVERLKSDSMAHQHNADGWAIASWALRIAGTVIFGGLSLVNLYGLLYAYLFPRLTIINYLTDLVRTVS